MDAENTNRLRAMCDFDATTLRCTRCGYKAKSLPHHRACKTIVELAEDAAIEIATRRITFTPPRPGTAIAAGLAAIGVTEELVKKLTGVKDCGCKGRQARLDVAAAAVTHAAERAVNAALNAVLPMPVHAEDVAAIANSLQASPLTNDGLKQGPPASEPTAPPA